MGQYFDVQKALNDGHSVAQIKQYMSVKGLKPLGSDSNPFDQTQATPTPASVATPAPTSVTQTPQAPAPTSSQPAPQGIPGFFQNVGSNAGSIISGLTKLPGAVANVAMHPDQLPQMGGNFAKGLFSEYNDLVGQPVNMQTGQLQAPSLQKAGEHAYNHPVDTALDVLPFMKPLEALAGGAKAAEGVAQAGKVAKGAEAATSALKTPVVGPVLNNAGNASKAALTKIFGAGELKNYAPGNTPILDTVQRYSLEDGSGHLPNYAQNTVVAQKSAGRAIENALMQADQTGAGVPLSRLREIAQNSEPPVLNSASQGIGASAVSKIDNTVLKYLHNTGQEVNLQDFTNGKVNVPTTLMNDLKQTFYKGASFGKDNPTPEQTLSRNLSLGLKSAIEKAVPDIKQANQDYWNLQQVGDHLQNHLDQTGKLGGSESLTTSLNPLNKLNTVPGQAAVAQVGSAAKAAPQAFASFFKNAGAGAATAGVKGGKVGSTVGAAEQAGRFAPSASMALADQGQTPTTQAAVPSATSQPANEMTFQDLTQKLSQEPSAQARKELVSVYKAQFSGKSSSNNSQAESGLINTTKLISDDISKNAGILNQGTVQSSNLSGVFGQGNPAVQKLQAEVTAYKQSVATTLHKRGMSDQQFKQLDPLFPNPGKDSVQQMQSKMSALQEFMGSFFAAQ